MKKLLIIQTDEAYFLFETLQVLEKNTNAFKNIELSILVKEESLTEIMDKSVPLLRGITFQSDNLLSEKFDLSVNLSLNEESWNYHSRVNSDRKIGTYIQEGQIRVDDLWSTYLLTLKARAPFLTFHLQDVYRNILGLKGRISEKVKTRPIKEIAIGTAASHLFPVTEQEIFIQTLSEKFPRIPLKDISEIDLVDEVSETLYIGPATLDALKFCEAGGRGIFLTSAFQGFNLIPYGSNHKILSSRGLQFKALPLLKYVENEITNLQHDILPYSVYNIDNENIFGSYLVSLNSSDDNYPFYQCHLVLWNFLLSLYDSNLEITKCSDSQNQSLKVHFEVLNKLVRLHDYAMVSVDNIYQESRSQIADASKIQGHIKNLKEIERISNQISASHSFLRPVLDFYHIRRGQNSGQTLQEQAQASLLIYSEEHQALKALSELFSVTLQKNEVSI